MTVVDDKYLDGMQLTTRKRPVGKDQTEKTIFLLQRLVEETFSTWCPHSQWLTEVYNTTVQLGGKSRHLNPKEWQGVFGDGIIAGVHEASVHFFCQKLTKEQVDWEMKLDMGFHINFLNGL